jgi:RNA recognition motif-containing protein
MGYGFLIFDSKENAEKALLELKGKIMPNTNNKTFQLNYASFNDRKNENEHSIYVCDLSHSVTSEKLISFFKSKYNSVIGGKIIIDPSTKLSKGYGFVTFSDEKEKEKAIIEMNGKILNDRAIKTGNAWHKKNEKFRSKKNHFYQNPQIYLQQQYQQLFNNPYFIANNYYANFFNPLFQQQMYSQLEEYFNNNNEDNNGRNDFSNNVNNIGKEPNY